MDATSLGSVSKTALTTLPKLIKKVFYFESFFSLSDEKKAEGISFLTNCVKKGDALEKYRQELMFSALKMTDSLELNDYTLRFYLSARVKHEGFCKALFNMKSLYYFHDSQVVIKRTALLGPLILLIASLIVGAMAFCSVKELINYVPAELSVSPKWLFNGLALLCAAVGSFVTLQCIFYALRFFIGYLSLKRHVTEFNIFISRMRIKRALRN